MQDSKYGRFGLSDVYTKSWSGAMEGIDILLSLPLLAHQGKPKDELSIWETSHLHNALISNKCAVIPGDFMKTAQLSPAHEARVFFFTKRKRISFLSLVHNFYAFTRRSTENFVKAPFHQAHPNMRRKEARADMGAQVPL